MRSNVKCIWGMCNGFAAQIKSSVNSQRLTIKEPDGQSGYINAWYIRKLRLTIILAGMEAIHVESQAHSQALAAACGGNHPAVRAGLSGGTAVFASGSE